MRFDPTVRETVRQSAHLRTWAAYLVLVPVVITVCLSDEFLQTMLLDCDLTRYPEAPRVEREAARNLFRGFA